MYKYMILHIPTGNYVSLFMKLRNKCRGEWFSCHVGHAFELPEDAEPVKFTSKTRAKLWLRQNQHKVKAVEFLIVEIAE